MNPFELIEKLINEHGSAAILREQIVLIRAEYTALERECNDLKAQAAKQKAEIDQQQLRLQDLEAKLEALQQGPLAKLVCAHCAGRQLTRTGTRPHPVFGDLGLTEAVMRCGGCGQLTYIEIPLD